jgi:hypothetical protein
MEDQKDDTAKFLREIPEYLRQFVIKNILEEYGFDPDSDEADINSLYFENSQKDTVLIPYFFYLSLSANVRARMVQLQRRPWTS